MRSLELDTKEWSAPLVGLMTALGNAKANRIWAADDAHSGTDAGGGGPCSCGGAACSFIHAGLLSTPLPRPMGGGGAPGQGSVSEGLEGFLRNISSNVGLKELP